MPRLSIDPKMRFRIFERDRFTCQYCGEHAPNVKLECDHVIPVSKGGKTEFDNLTTACTDCNAGKGNIVVSNRSVPVSPSSVREVAILEAQEAEVERRAEVSRLSTEIMAKPRLQRDEAAVYISIFHGVPCSPKTLAKLACIGGGPAFVKAGRKPLYPKSALDAWVQSKLSRELLNTSEHITDARHA